MTNIGSNWVSAGDNNYAVAKISVIVRVLKHRGA